MSKPVRWMFRPYVTVARSDDGTFEIRSDWQDCHYATYDAGDDEIFDELEIGCKILDAWLKERYGEEKFIFPVHIAGYLPDGWVEPETEEQRARREALEDLQALRKSLETVTPAGETVSEAPSSPAADRRT